MYLSLSRARSRALSLQAAVDTSEVASLYPAPPECELATDVPLLFNSTSLSEVPVCYVIEDI